jgi:hypothetical protein
METCPMGNVLSNRLSGNFAIKVADCIAPVYVLFSTMLFIRYELFFRRKHTEQCSDLQSSRGEQHILVYPKAFIFAIK